MIQITQELREYAEYMGVDLEREPYLFDLISSAASAPLPDGWVYEDDGDDMRYIGPDGRVLQEHPIDESIRQKIAQMRPRDVTDSILYRQPTEEEICKTLLYFECKFTFPDIRQKCMEFLMQIPKGWRVFQFEGRVFFSNGKVEQYTHPGEQAFKNQLVQLQEELNTNKKAGKNQPISQIGAEELTPQKTAIQLTSTSLLSETKCEASPDEENFTIKPPGDLRKAATKDEPIDQPNQVSESNSKSAVESSIQIQRQELEKVQQQFDEELIQMREAHEELAKQELEAYKQQIDEIRQDHADEVRDLRNVNIRELQELKLERQKSDCADECSDEMAEMQQEHRRLTLELQQYQAELAEYENEAFQLQSALAELREARSEVENKNSTIKQLERQVTLLQVKPREVEHGHYVRCSVIEPLRKHIEELETQLKLFKAEIDALICSYTGDAARSGQGIRYVDARIAEYRTYQERFRELSIMCDLLDAGVDNACKHYDAVEVESVVRELLWEVRQQHSPRRDRKWIEDFKNRLDQETDLALE